MAVVKSNSKAATTSALMFMAAAAVVVVVMALSLCRLAEAGDDPWCIDLKGCTIASCRDRCRGHGFVNPVINCWQQPGDTAPSTCCCFNPKP